jgi:hypothetical protein
MKRKGFHAAPCAGSRLGAAKVQFDFRKIERRKRWLWATAGSITLLLAVALGSFVLPGLPHDADTRPFVALPEAIRALVGLVFLFELYVIYQQREIFRIRRQLIEREALFDLINENVALACPDRLPGNLVSGLRRRPACGECGAEPGCGRRREEARSRLSVSC